MPLVVLDTNVLVAGLLNPRGAPGRIVDLWLIGKIAVAYDDRILAEYEEVLARPKLRIRPQEAHGVLHHLRLSGVAVLAPPLEVRQASAVPDPDDVPFVEVALAAGAEALVTGNAAHFLGVATLVRLMSPAAFLDYLAGPAE